MDNIYRILLLCEVLLFRLIYKYLKKNLVIVDSILVKSKLAKRMKHEAKQEGKTSLCYKQIMIYLK